jgi:hypothetical protein
MPNMVDNPMMLSKAPPRITQSVASVIPFGEVTLTLVTVEQFAHV